jgi:hypothetical protein
MRLAHYSFGIEKSYDAWIKRFILYHNKRHPREMGTPEIDAYRTHLAKSKHVSASMQNQALQVILYLYKKIQHIEIGNRV